MDDLYSYLIGAAPTDPQKQSAIADQLRRRRAFGELGAVTGDRVLQPFGQGLEINADTSAKQLQDTRQKDIDNAQTKEYETGQLKHLKAQEALTERGQTLDHIYQMLMAQAANTKAANTGSTKIPRLRQGDIKDLQDMAQDIGEFNDLEDFIKKGHGFGAIEVGGHAVPGARAFSNFFASHGYGSEESKSAFAAKQKFDRLYTLGARNRLFGATLTTNEQNAWKNANPDTRQSDAQIAGALPVLRKVFEHRLAQKSRGLMRENYDPDAISEYADLNNLGIDVNSGAPGGHGSPGRRVKVDMSGNPVGD